MTKKYYVEGFTKISHDIFIMKVSRVRLNGLTNILTVPDYFMYVPKYFEQIQVTKFSIPIIIQKGSNIDIDWDGWAPNVQESAFKADLMVAKVINS